LNLRSPPSAVSIIVALITQVTAIILFGFSLFLLFALLAIPAARPFPTPALVPTTDHIHIAFTSDHAPFFVFSVIPQPGSAQGIGIS
jgi:hypothetical protein